MAAIAYQDQKGRRFTQGEPLFRESTFADYDWTEGTNPDEESHEIAVWPLRDGGYGVLHRRILTDRVRDIDDTDLDSRHDDPDAAVAAALKAIEEIREDLAVRESASDAQAFGYEEMRISEFEASERNTWSPAP